MGFFSRKSSEASKPLEKLINEIAIAQVVGKGFSKILEAGQPIANFHWLNAAAAASPWNEGEEVVNAMLATAERWDVGVLHDEVRPLVRELQEIEQGERQVTLERLADIERQITKYLRASMWTAVAGARLFSPSWAFHGSWDGTPDEEEPVLFFWMREQLHHYELLLMSTVEGSQVSWAGAVTYGLESVIPGCRHELRVAAETNAEILP